MVERARIVLSAAEGLTAGEISQRVGCSRPTVTKWRGRYAGDGIEGAAGRAPVRGAVDAWAGDAGALARSAQLTT